MTPLPLRRICLVAMAVLTWGASAALGQVPDRLVGRVVREAQLRSAGQAVRDAQLEGLIEIQRGQPLEMAAVRETIVHLMGMGRYIDVQVSAFEDGDGVRVEIDLVPLHDVRRIVFTGELGLPEHTLRESVVDRFGSSPSNSRAADIVRALEELLANHGFLRAKVELAPSRRRPRRTATSCSTWPPAPGPWCGRCRTGPTTRRTRGNCRRACRSSAGVVLRSRGAAPPPRRSRRAVAGAALLRGQG